MSTDVMSPALTENDLRTFAGRILFAADSSAQKRLNICVLDGVVWYAVVQRDQLVERTNSAQRAVDIYNALK